MSAAPSRGAGGRGCPHQAGWSHWEPWASVQPNSLRVVSGKGPGACTQGPSALPLFSFLRLIREQLLEGDFTVNMRLLQVLVFRGRHLPGAHPLSAAGTGRLRTGGLRVWTPDADLRLEGFESRLWH